jgi:hypothetical protein
MILKNVPLDNTMTRKQREIAFELNLFIKNIENNYKIYGIKNQLRKLWKKFGNPKNDSYIPKDLEEKWKKFLKLIPFFLDLKNIDEFEKELKKFIPVESDDDMQIDRYDNLKMNINGDSVNNSGNISSQIIRKNMKIIFPINHYNSSVTAALINVLERIENMQTNKGNIKKFILNFLKVIDNINSKALYLGLNYLEDISSLRLGEENIDQQMDVTIEFLNSGINIIFIIFFLLFFSIYYLSWEKHKRRRILD